MSGRKKQRTRRHGWIWAVGGSFVVHALVLSVVVRGGVGAAPSVAPETIAVDLAPDVVAPAMATIASLTAAELPDPPPRASVVVPVPLLDARQGERDNAVPLTVAPREGDGRTRAAPAADEGTVGGLRSERASRRDRSELQSRVADAEDPAQPARLKTSRRTSSPQAIRRERATGVGDSVRTTDATRPPAAAAPDNPLAAAAPDVAGPAAGAPSAALVVPVTKARESDHPTATVGVGPLDAERGARQFDTETPGRAADAQTTRAVSNATHLGITDYSHASVAAPTESREGRGPGEAPGAVARASAGTAPSVTGAHNPQQLAAELAERTRERVYNHYRQEIQSRIKDAMVFPKQLALRLEQGEAVVRFSVRPDGTLGDGPHLVKSSGFDEFDTEAVKVVLRAAPFPRRPETTGLSFLIPVTFENPLVR
jgi:TonB family protein